VDISLLQETNAITVKGGNGKRTAKGGADKSN